MQNLIFRSAIILMAFYSLQSFCIKAVWQKGGSNHTHYQMELDNSVNINGHAVRTIKSLDENTSGFGTYTTEIPAGKFTGNRIRISGLIKKSDSKNIGGMWVMTDGTFSKVPENRTSRDDSKEMSKKSSTDWIMDTLEFDIPEDANSIVYGACLYGKGQIWFDNLKIDIVPKK